jgi:ABC-type transport system involved in multi-copper enzyme maturation permease subunit
MSAQLRPRVAQALAVMRLEIRKHFLGRRALLVWLLAAMPVVLLAVRAFALQVLQQERTSLNLGEDTGIFAMIFQGFILRFVVFFGSVGIFAHLARGDVLDKSLHYWFLTPVRREVVVAGKYAAGVLASVVIFSMTTLGSLFFLYLPHGWQQISQYFLQGPGLGHVGAYLFVVLLGCVGYGALFLTLGLRFKNPIAISVAVLGWESASFLMPEFLKRLTMVHYLEALCPIPVSAGPFALLSDPPSAWLSVPGIVALSAALLWMAGHAIRRMDVQYGTD